MKRWCGFLAAIEKYRDEFPGHGADNARRMRGLVLLLRYAGMGIADAVSVTTEKIDGNRLYPLSAKDRCRGKHSFYLTSFRGA